MSERVMAGGGNKSLVFLGFLDEREEEGKRDYLLTHSMPLIIFFV